MNANDQPPTTRELLEMAVFALMEIAEELKWMNMPKCEECGGVIVDDDGGETGEAN